MTKETFSIVLITTIQESRSFLPQIPRGELLKCREGHVLKIVFLKAYTPHFTYPRASHSGLALGRTTLLFCFLTGAITNSDLVSHSFHNPQAHRTFQTQQRKVN